MTESDRSAELKQLAHDVRNALHGVAINLEVVRGRAERGIEVAQLAPFIDTAAQQLEAATRLQKRYTDLVNNVVAQAVHGNHLANSTHDNTSSRN